MSVMYSSATSSTHGNQWCKHEKIIRVTSIDDNDNLKQYQHQHHLVELYNTTSNNHPKRHSAKALTLTFSVPPKTKGKQPPNTCTAPPVMNDSIKQSAENKSVQER